MTSLPLNNHPPFRQLQPLLPRSLYLQQRLQEADNTLEDVQRERDEIQERNTVLQADIQRSRSLQRLQEETIEKQYGRPFSLLVLDTNICL